MTENLVRPRPRIEPGSPHQYHGALPLGHHSMSLQVLEIIITALAAHQQGYLSEYPHGLSTMTSCVSTQHRTPAHGAHGTHCSSVNANVSVSSDVYVGQSDHNPNVVILYAACDLYSSQTLDPCDHQHAVKTQPFPNTRHHAYLPRVRTRAPVHGTYPRALSSQARTSPMS